MPLGGSIKLFVFATLMLSALTTPARAQIDTARATPALLPALQRLEPGASVRIYRPQGFLMGRFERVTSDSLYLDAGALALSTLQRVDVWQRSTRRGMKTGALIGAPAAALYGGFIALLANTESDVSASETAALVLGGGAFGLVAGGALGAVVGAAIPRWVSIADPAVRIPARIPARNPAAPPVTTIGSVSVTPAYAKLTDGGSGGIGVRAAYMFHSTHISAGPEIGAYGLGESERSVPAFCPGVGACEIAVPGPERVSHAGGIARIGTGATRRIEPFATVGVGLYSWSGWGEYGGYSLGGGLQIRNASRRQSVFAEGRWQSNLTRTGNENSALGFYTIGIGGALGW